LFVELDCCTSLVYSRERVVVVVVDGGCLVLILILMGWCGGGWCGGWLAGGWCNVLSMDRFPILSAVAISSTSSNTNSNVSEHFGISKWDITVYD
jgi:hypothetical protein